MFIQRSILEFALIAGTFSLLPLKNVDAQEKMRTQKEADKKYCYQSERKIPIAYSVDVAVIGGSAAAVAAAVNAAQNGAKVFLAAQESYLGEDVCGTYRFWNVPSQVLNTSLGNKLFGNGLPVPLKFKQTLDRELLDHKIDFLFSCFVTDLITDGQGNPAGVVIANRSGRQAILAKVLIDATPRSLLGHMTSATYTPYPSGMQDFKFTVVGNKEKQLQNGTVLVMPEHVVFKDKNYQAIEYTIPIAMKDGSIRSFANAEQIARDLTWDPDQVECGDLLFQVPPDHVTGKISSQKADPESIELEAFQPQKVQRLFLLNGLADISRSTATELLRPGGMIRIGERIGKEAAILSLGSPVAKNIKIKGTTREKVIRGDVGELLKGIRPEKNQQYVISENTTLPVLGSFDVIVMGGGTAGAPAAVGAARNGAKTVVLEYLHGLGGIGTAGMIDKYYHGYRKGYTNEVDFGVQAIGAGNARQMKKLDQWVFDWKTEYFRQEIRKAGGEIWFGILGCGAYCEKGKVKGVVVATPEGKGVILGHTIVDSSGSGDIAIAAGSGFVTTDGNSVAVQGAGMPFKNPNDSYNNTDWTFTDDTDMLDIWWTYIVAKDKFPAQYDIGKLPQTRERRRIVGDYTVSVMDIYNHRTYPDVISIHQSSFDTHGYTEDPFFFLKPPADAGKDVIAFVPFRALLPKGIEGIVVTGLGASADRDAMPVIRMQPCLQNQGYAVGWAAAIAAKNNQMIRKVDLKPLQKELVKMENLPDSILTRKDNFPNDPIELKKAANSVTKNLEGLELLLWDKPRSIPFMVEALNKSTNPSDRLTYSRILGILGNDAGWQVLLGAVDTVKVWDSGWNYRGMGQFGRSISELDGLLIALGRTQKAEAVESIARLAGKLSSLSELSHFRAVAMALEMIGDPAGASVLYNLLKLPGVTGYSMPDIQTARSQTLAAKDDNIARSNSLRELFLARALYRCGDVNGLGNEILTTYSKDLRAHYSRHAREALNLYAKKPEIQPENKTIKIEEGNKLPVIKQSVLPVKTDKKRIK